MSIFKARARQSRIDKKTYRAKRGRRISSESSQDGFGCNDRGGRDAIDSIDGLPEVVHHESLEAQFPKAGW